MKFVKMQGIGNDYIIADCVKRNTIKDPGTLAKRISDRHFGVGSDGLIIIRKSKTADFKMEIYNSDGSVAEMCGNGIRQVGKYLYDHGYLREKDGGVSKEKVTVETLGGVKKLELKTENGKCTGSVVDMGEPELRPEKIPVLAEKDEKNIIERPVQVAGREYKITCVSMGNPHAVVFLEDGEDPDSIEIEKIGPLFECNSIFPKKTNTEFVKVIDRTHIKMRVWERGAAETLACGTGASAVCVAACLTGKCDREVEITLRGGKLRIKWDEETNHVFMEGPAEEICTLWFEE